MTLKKEGSIDFDRITKQLDYLNKHQVVIGFFAESGSRLLTIVRANEYGAHIIPKNGQYLWVPSRDCIKEYSKSVTPKDVKEEMFVPKGHRVAYVKKNGKLVVFFYLLKKVDIPARPFLRKAAENNRKKYARVIKDGLEDIIYKGGTGEALLTDLGRRGASDVRRSIREWTKPGNAPLTIANKMGNDNPLIDRGKLGQAVTWKILPVGGTK